MNRVLACWCVVTISFVTKALAQPHKFKLVSPNGCFEAVFDFDGLPRFKIVEKTTGKTALAMDEENVSNRGVTARWTPDSRTIAVMMEWRLGSHLYLCRRVANAFQLTDGPTEPEDHLTILKWRDRHRLELKGDKRRYVLFVSESGAKYLR